MGTRSITAVYILYHRVAHNNWIFICFSAITCRSLWGFSPLFLTLLIVFVCSGFFPLDLSRPIWFRLSHVLLLRLTCLSLGFTTCFYLIRTELCSYTTSNNFCLFEQLSSSSLFSASTIPTLVWTSLTWTSTNIGSLVLFLQLTISARILWSSSIKEDFIAIIFPQSKFSNWVSWELTRVTRVLVLGSRVPPMIQIRALGSRVQVLNHDLGPGSQVLPKSSGSWVPFFRYAILQKVLHYSIDLILYIILMEWNHH